VTKGRKVDTPCSERASFLAQDCGDHALYRKLIWGTSGDVEVLPMDLSEALNDRTAWRLYASDARRSSPMHLLVGKLYQLFEQAGDCDWCLSLGSVEELLQRDGLVPAYLLIGRPDLPLNVVSLASRATPLESISAVLMADLLVLNELCCVCIEQLSPLFVPCIKRHRHVMRESIKKAAFGVEDRVIHVKIITKDSRIVRTSLYGAMIWMKSREYIHDSISNRRTAST
jgi:hypothetical protein